MTEPSAEPVRRAIAAGDFAHALDLWNGYVAALAEGNLTRTSLAEAADLVAWSRPFLLRGRDYAAARLRALHVAGAYRTRTTRPNARVRASF